MNISLDQFAQLSVRTLNEDICVDTFRPEIESINLLST